MSMLIATEKKNWEAKNKQFFLAIKMPFYTLQSLRVDFST